MPWLRYLLYFIAIAFVTWALTQMELVAPGSLKLHIMVSETDQYGTSEFSPLEIIQAIILGVCGVIMWWVPAIARRSDRLQFRSVAWHWRI